MMIENKPVGIDQKEAWGNFWGNGNVLYIHWVFVKWVYLFVETHQLLYTQDLCILLFISYTSVKNKKTTKQYVEWFWEDVYRGRMGETFM